MVRQETRVVEWLPAGASLPGPEPAATGAAAADAGTEDADAALVAAALSGSMRGFRGLYEKYAERIYHFAHRFLGDEQHAEDATQEVFLQVFRKLNGFRGDAKFSTWLFRVTVNTCKNKRRSLDRDRRFDPVTVARRTRLGEHVAPPEQELGQHELEEEIQRALSSLTEEHRAIVLMKGTRGLSYEDIGAILGQSENQVRGKLYRARKVFRDALEASRAGGRRPEGGVA